MIGAVAGYSAPMTDEHGEHTLRTDDGTTVIRTDDDRRDGIASASGHRNDDAHLTETELSRLRTMLHDGSFDDGSSRIKWFLIGFVTALVALVVAAGAFLVVSDDDDDGQVDLDVPTVDVDG